MLYKEIKCPTCDGYGFISDYNSISSKLCKTCNGLSSIVVPMTNGDLIRTCDNEQLKEVYDNINTYAIYSGGNNNRLLNESPEDFLLWLNKETDDLDLETIFNFINKEDYENPYLKEIKYASKR